MALTGRSRRGDGKLILIKFTSNLECEGVDWIQVFQDRIQWWYVVKTVIIVLHS